MPKAKPYPDGEEHELTHVESQWEDEASTTVEQGEVADKVRTLGFAKHTQTGSGVDEPTMDDQQAPVLSAITPIRQDNTARLIISQGNDAGQELEIRPGKTYTIGRGLDNDVVLTDIAVSRKHFDVKFEDGAWIIVDRGSGNGTVVNGNVEDNPFMLASGDMIEIGNTVFRYDQPNGAPRASQRSFDDDDEMSTVAGKPLRHEAPEHDPPPPPQRPARAKTMPPPVPLRPTHASAPPPLSYREPPPPLLPASTMPMPQMNRPPMGPGSPTMLGDSMGMPMAPPHMHNIPMSANGMPTTIPGQGLQQRSSYPYPQAAEIPPHSVHAQMLLIQTQGGRRGDGSTAHVPPQHYDPMVHMAPPRYSPPQLTKRAKLAIAGIGLALLTGIVTAAVVKSGAPKPKAPISAKDTGKTAKKAETKKAETKKAETKPIAAKPTVEPIVVPAKDAPKGSEPAKVETAKQDLAVAKVDPKKAEQEAAAQKAKADQEAAAQKAKADQEAAQKAKAQQEADAKAQQDAKARAAKAEQDTARKADRQAAREEATRKAEQARLARAEAKKAQDRRRETRSDTTTTTPKQRVAVATDSTSARDKADGLYRSKKFNDAANVLASAAKAADEDDARELRNLSNAYSLLGKALALGTAPAQKASVAFAALQSALNHDATAGGTFKTEITDKLGAVAPKAAVAFIGQKDYAKARSAYLAAQRAGSTDSNLALVKQKLEAVANELYNAAAAEASSNPGPAKEKLKQIKQLVDAKSPIATKAQALYNKL